MTQADKQPIFLRPTLIIGLGGTGSKIVLEAKARLEETFGSNGYKAAIKFLSFDTANENLVTTQPNHPDKKVIFSPEQEFVRISDVPLHDLMQSRDTNPAIAAILPEILQSTQIDQGAQQVRRLGRVALFYHYPRVREKLIQTISDLRDVQVMGKIGETKRHHIHVRDRGRLRVFLICSICGGTGSGTFLDIAYLVRHIAKDAGIDDARAVDVIGMLLLPEVFHEISTTGWDRIRANAYAALLDMEYYNQPRRADEALYRVDFPGEQVHVEGPPFSLAYLVSSSGKDSTLKGLTDLAPLLGEALHTMISSRVGEQLDATLDNIRGSLSRYFRGYRAFYSALGIAQLVYPSEWLKRQFTEHMKYRMIRERIRFSSPQHLQDAREEAVNFAQIARSIIDTTINQRLSVEDVTRSLTSLRADVHTREDAINELQQAYREALQQHQQQVVAQVNANRQVAEQMLYDRFYLEAKKHLDAGLKPVMGSNYRGIQWTNEWLNRLRNTIQDDFTNTMDPSLLLNQEISQLMEQMNVPILGPTLVNRYVRQASVRLSLYITNDLHQHALEKVRHAIFNDFQTVIDDVQDQIIQMDLQWQNTLYKEEPLGKLGELPKTTQTILSPGEISTRIDKQATIALADDGIYNALHQHLQNHLQIADWPLEIDINGVPERNERPGLSASLFGVSHAEIVQAIESFAQAHYDIIEGDKDIAAYLLATQQQEEAQSTAEATVSETFLSAADARTMVGKLAQQANPLLAYADGMLQAMRPFEIQVLAAMTKKRAQKIREIGLSGVTDLSEVETNEPTTITLLSTRHGIPVLALNRFEDYRRLYVQLKQDPTTIMHLTKEHEINPYDPGSYYFVNLEDLTTYFARTLAYEYIRPVTDGNTRYFAYSSDFFSHLKQRAEAELAKLDSEVRDMDAQLKSNQLVEGSYEYLILEVTSKQHKKQINELSIFLQHGRSTTDGARIIFSYTQNLAEKTTLVKEAHTLADALLAVEASPMRKISQLFLQTMYDLLQRDPNAGNRFTHLEDNRLEQVKRFLQVRGFIVEDAALDLNGSQPIPVTMRWTHPGEPSYEIEMRMSSVLLVYYRIARLQQRSRRLPAGYLLKRSDIDQLDNTPADSEGT